MPERDGADLSSGAARSSPRSQLDPAGTQIEQAWDDAVREPPRDGADLLEPPAFAHPQWTVGVVLILAVVMLFLGVFGHPLWLLFGAPFILTLCVWVAVKTVEFRRHRGKSER